VAKPRPAKLEVVHSPAAHTNLTFTPASVSARTASASAARSVMSSLTAVTSQILANATFPTLELSATTTTHREHLIMTPFVLRFHFLVSRAAGPRVDAVDADERDVEVESGQARLGDGPRQLIGRASDDPPVTISLSLGRTASSDAMLSALVTIVSFSWSASARATSVAVVPPVSPMAIPSDAYVAASRAMRRSALI
jgi:hypothetical protein